MLAFLKGDPAYYRIGTQNLKCERFTLFPYSCVFHSVFVNCQRIQVALHIEKDMIEFICIPNLPSEKLEEISSEELKIGSNVAPKSVRPCAGDAYLLFQVV